MKKSVVLISLTLLSISLRAAIFPSYDFTFYTTADETLTSFTSENVGIDVTGYGFVGTTSPRGIYLRIGIQTPFETLIKIKDMLFSSTKKTETEQSGHQAVAGEDERESLENYAQTQIGLDSSSGSNKTKETTIDPTKWKFLLTLGPAWRNMMDDNAMVYIGLGVSLSVDYINDFSYENGDYYSSFTSVFGTDMDAGFRIGLSHSSTTIRVGVHFITDLVGYVSLNIYDRERITISKESFLYGYIAGKQGIASATTGRGYVRLAKTLNERKKVKYNYSNTTNVVGNGKIETIVL